MSGRFNIRVYGIWIEEQRVLVSEELIKGQSIIKFIGGGLQFGEGIVNCLKREWMEELELDIEVESHLYTTDFFQPSAFDDSQVISIYYKVKPINAGDYIFNKNENERSYWQQISEITEDTFTLPIDKLVGRMLLAQYK